MSEDIFVCIVQNYYSTENKNRKRIWNIILAMVFLHFKFIFYNLNMFILFGNWIYII